MPYRDTWASCSQCGRQFVFTVEEQRRLAGLGFELTPPSLCPDCLRAHEMTPGPHEGVVKWYDPEKGSGLSSSAAGMRYSPPERPGSRYVGDHSDKARVRYRIQPTGRGRRRWMSSWSSR